MKLILPSSTLANVNTLWTVAVQTLYDCILTCDSRRKQLIETDFNEHYIKETLTQKYNLNK